MTVVEKIDEILGKISVSVVVGPQMTFKMALTDYYKNVYAQCLAFLDGCQAEDKTFLETTFETTANIEIVDQLALRAVMLKKEEMKGEVKGLLEAAFVEFEKSFGVAGGDMTKIEKSEPLATKITELALDPKVQYILGISARDGNDIETVAREKILKMLKARKVSQIVSKVAKPLWAESTIETVYKSTEVGIGGLLKKHSGDKTFLQSYWTVQDSELGQKAAAYREDLAGISYLLGKNKYSDPGFDADPSIRCMYKNRMLPKGLMLATILQTRPIDRFVQVVKDAAAAAAKVQKPTMPKRRVFKRHSKYLNDDGSYNFAKLETSFKSSIKEPNNLFAFLVKPGSTVVFEPGKLKKFDIGPYEKLFKDLEKKKKNLKQSKRSARALLVSKRRRGYAPITNNLDDLSVQIAYLKDVIAVMKAGDQTAIGRLHPYNVVTSLGKEEDRECNIRLDAKEIEQGRLYMKDGAAHVWNHFSTTFEKANTNTHYCYKDIPGFAGIVITKDGSMHLFKHYGGADPGYSQVRFHTMVSGGREVLFAGGVKFNKNTGKVASIRDDSGHYQPDIGSICEMIKCLVKHELIDKNTELCLWCCRDQALEKKLQNLVIPDLSEHYLVKPEKVCAKVAKYLKGIIFPGRSKSKLNDAKIYLHKIANRLKGDPDFDQDKFKRLVKSGPDLSSLTTSSTV